MACLCPLCCSNASRNFTHVSLSLPSVAKKHPFAYQVGEHADILVALAHTHLIDADTTYGAEIRLGIGSVHLAKEHPPQARVGFADHRGHFAHGHLAHEQQREGFKLFGEVRAQSFPGRTHAENVAALTALAPWQLTGDLATVLEDIEMPPRQRFCVVIAKDQTTIPRAACRLPKSGRLSNLQIQPSRFPARSDSRSLPSFKT